MWGIHFLYLSLQQAGYMGRETCPVSYMPARSLYQHQDENINYIFFNYRLPVADKFESGRGAGTELSWLGRYGLFHVGILRVFVNKHRNEKLNVSVFTGSRRAWKWMGSGCGTLLDAGEIWPVSYRHIKSFCK